MIVGRYLLRSGMRHALLTSLERRPIYGSSRAGWDAERRPGQCRARVYNSLCSAQLGAKAMTSGKVGVLRRRQPRPLVVSAPCVRMEKRDLGTVSDIARTQNKANSHRSRQ